MRKTVLLFIVVSCLMACNVYKPIVHVNRYFQPTEYVHVLNEPPKDFSSYFGTIKVVPTDYSTPTKKDMQKAIEKIIETAKQCGANRIYIRNYDPRTSDFVNLKFLDVSFGDGAAIEAELYR